MTSPLCNAVLAEEKGRCTKLAGFMTDHPGEGHCYKHGGLSAPAVDDFRNALETHGLGGIVTLAEQMDGDEAEYVAHVSSAALLTVRAKLIAQLIDEGRSPKEQSELALALRRVEASIKALEDGTPLGLADEEAIAATERAEAEESRLKGLAAKYG